MGKQWGEILSEVINLGFEKNKAYEKNKAAFIEAFNWAQGFIASTISPITDSLIIEKTASEGLYEYYDLLDIIEKKGGQPFVCLIKQAPIILKNNDGGYIPIEDYILEKNRNLLLKGDISGTVEVSYCSYPEKMDILNMNDYISRIDNIYLNILPYLMAHRLWLDDDMSKATLYWNLYDDMKNQIKESTTSVVSAQVIIPPWAVD